jgi:hypothetical protein
MHTHGRRDRLTMAEVYFGRFMGGDDATLNTPGTGRRTTF